ncbi:MAG: VWA domain-containing protein [Microcystaceae cyanobacterium]
MTVTQFRRPFWRYALFQIPAIFLSIFLILALLFALLRLGQPPVAVVIALDMSQSTYGNDILASETILDEEFGAVAAYLNLNTAKILRRPNKIKVLGFADGVIHLTPNFDDNSEELISQLDNARKPDIPLRIGGGTNADLAIQEGISALSGVEKRCRELLLVTDGEVTISQTMIEEAILRNVRINAIVIGNPPTLVDPATRGTGGVALEGDRNTLSTLFTDQLFTRFNSNVRWVIFWLGCAWMALMWLLTMPLDRWIFQGLLRIRMDYSGQLALGNAIAWTVLTPLFLGLIYRLLNLAAPFFGGC